MTYTAAGKDVTSRVVAGTFYTPWTDSAESTDMTVRITVRSSAAVGSRLSRTLTITSNGDGRKVG